MVGWIVFLAVALPLLALFAWLLFDESIVNIPAGRLGLLLIKGRATDKVLQPGPHWVPALRRRTVAEYPSLELSYRAVRDVVMPAEPGELERSGPAVRGTLGDRTAVTIGYTVRFRLDEGRLRSVHERFGPEGVWSAVQDVTARTVRARLSAPGIGVDDLYGAPFIALDEAIGAAVAEALDAESLTMRMFALGHADLGRTGDVIQSTARARLEQQREEAESTVRLTRARIDAELEPYLANLSDAALRYREVDVWRELVHSQIGHLLAIPGRTPSRTVPETVEPAPDAETATTEGVAEP